MKNLNLSKPLAVIDVETTGIDVVKDRIVQFAIIKTYPNGKQQKLSDLVNPEMHIPSEASQIHGITNETVKGSPTFAFYANTIVTFIKGCDLAGFNLINFDLPFLQEELARCGIELDTENRAILDPMIIYHLKEPRNLATAYNFYCGKKLEKAHDALADAQAALEVLEGQLEKYKNLPRDAEKLHALCNPENSKWVTKDRKFAWRDGKACLNFGKYSGKTLEWVKENDPDYLRWIAEEGDFTLETKKVVKATLAEKTREKKEKKPAQGLFDLG